MTRQRLGIVMAGGIGLMRESYNGVFLLALMLLSAGTYLAYTGSPE